MRTWKYLYMKKGDAIETVARPVSKVIDWFFGTDLQGCSGCKQMQNNLNSGMSLADSVIARWFSSKQQEGEIPMGSPYVVTEQYVIEEADSPKDALAKHLSGQSESISIHAQVRPQPRQPVTAPKPTTS